VHIFPRFGILYQEKSGNPGGKSPNPFFPAKKTDVSNLINTFISECVQPHCRKLHLQKNRCKHFLHNFSRQILLRLKNQIIHSAKNKNPVSGKTTTRTNCSL
jgi:hypothetical protein